MLNKILSTGLFLAAFVAGSHDVCAVERYAPLSPLVGNPIGYAGPVSAKEVRHLAPPGQNGTSAAYTLIDEDFTGIQYGTPDAPDMSRLLCSYSDYTLGAYFDGLASGTWSGDQVYPAGGAVALCSPGVLGTAFINTPLGDYSGDLTVTFKIKLNGENNGYVYLYMCHGDIYTPQTSKGENCTSSFNLYPGDTNWTEVTANIRNLSSNNDGFFQIVVTGGGTVVIDDFKITSTPNFIAPPIIEPATYTADSFICNWQPVRRAFDYKLRMYEKSYASDKDMDTEFNFDDLRPDGSNLPDDWYFSRSAKGDIVAAGEGNSGSSGIRLCPGDTIITMDNNTKYREAVYWMKSVWPDPEAAKDDFESMFYVEGWSGEQWIPLASFYMSFFTDGDDISMVETGEAYMIDFADKFSRLRFTLRDCQPEAYVVLDDFCFTTPPAEGYTLVPTFDGYDYAVVDTPYFEAIYNCGLKDYPWPKLDPEKDYRFEVCSHYLFENSEYVSGDATGVCRPVPLEPSDVSEDSYTANWKYTPHAEYYIVDNFGVVMARSDVRNAVMLKEDFSKVSSTISDPKYPEELGNMSPLDLSRFTEYTGWMGRNNIIVDGMLGMKGKGYMSTPPVNLSNNSSFVLRISGYATAGDAVRVTTASGSSYLIAIEGKSDMNRFDSEITIPENAADEMIVFTSETSRPVLFDEISILQTVKAGKRVYTYLSTKEVDASSTSVSFDGLENDGFSGYAYRISAVRTVNDIPMTGGVSVFQSVGSPSKTEILSGVEEIEAISDNVRAVFSADGLKLDAPVRGVNILLMRDGTTRKVILRN